MQELEQLKQSEQLVQLKQWIDESDNIVFFGGAGVSTESGIPKSFIVSTKTK